MYPPTHIPIIVHGPHPILSETNLFFPLTRYDYRGASSRPNTNLTKAVYTYWREQALAARQATGVKQNFAIQHVSSNLVQQGNLKGGNPLNLPAGSSQCTFSIPNTLCAVCVP